MTMMRSLGGHLGVAEMCGAGRKRSSLGGMRRKVSAVRWLDEGSPAAIAEALKRVAPALGDYPIAVRESVGEDDPLWWSATAVVGERFVAKFAWSRPAALRLAHEIAVLAALARGPAVRSCRTWLRAAPIHCSW